MSGHPPATLATSPQLPRSAKRSGLTATSSWQAYYGGRGTHRLLWVGMLFSIGVHVVVLFGFNHHKKKVVQKVADDGPTVTLVMPELKDLEEPEPQPSDQANTADAGLSVPTLADVPTMVDLSSFVQEVDYSSLTPQTDLSAAKSLTIPVHIGHGRPGEGSLGQIFNLKDLDHNPEPTLKIAPVFPTSLKQAGMQAEVVVGFIVTADGSVVNAYVLKSTDHRFDDSALMAISKWRFRAGIKNGRKVNVRMAQPFPFIVRDDS